MRLDDRIPNPNQKPATVADIEAVLRRLNDLEILLKVIIRRVGGV
jgi:hypothetical protein